MLKFLSRRLSYELTRPFTLKEFMKTLVIGVIKGLIYYLIFYVVLLGLVLYYVIPYVLSLFNTSLAVNVNELAEMISYDPVNIRLLSLFILLSIAGSVLSRHVPYGSVISPFIGLVLLYVVLLEIGFGVFSGVFNEYHYAVDLSPLMKKLLITTLVFTIANAVLAFRRELIKNKAGHAST